MKLVRYKLEKEIESTSQMNQNYLYERLIEILESDKEPTSKADYIGLSILSIDNKLQAIEDEIADLRELKLKLNEAKDIAKEVGAKVFEKYGIDKLEGLRISSLTIHAPIVTPKVNFTVLNEYALIDAGFKKEVLDLNKVKESYNNGEYLDLIHAHCEISITRDTSIKKLKINKRRGSNNPTLEEQFKEVS